MATKTKELNIIISGTGGQGVVLLSELLGSAAVRDGIAVKGSEVLGMAQRGGSVFSNIRLGGDALAPLTPEGRVDVIIAVEPSEALRNIQYLVKGGVVVLNSRTVLPFTVFLGMGSYPTPKEIQAGLSKVTDKIITLDATAIALAAGSIQAANVVMLGALYGTGLMPMSIDTAKAAIMGRFKGKAGETNIKAFDLGYEEVQKALKKKPGKSNK
jgi:indolepyruvate ferredoxin oxidoreductase, beta subunit